jgi:hypothetical protein
MHVLAHGFVDILSVMIRWLAMVAHYPCSMR